MTGLLFRPVARKSQRRSSKWPGQRGKELRGKIWRSGWAIRGKQTRLGRKVKSLLWRGLKLTLRCPSACERGSSHVIRTRRHKGLIQLWPWLQPWALCCVSGPYSTLLLVAPSPFEMVITHSSLLLGNCECSSVCSAHASPSLALSLSVHTGDPRGPLE